MGTLPQTEVENECFEVVIDPLLMGVTKKSVGQALGYVDREIPRHFEEMIEEILTRMPALCEIRAGYKVLSVTVPTERDDGLIIGNVFLSLDKIVTSRLKDSEKAAIIVCTVGRGMEDWRRQLMRNEDHVRGHFVDTAASAAVESAADLLSEHIRAKALELRMMVTNRYSPGYCGWPVSDQQLLFSLLPEGFCGVGLTESSLMIPMKSISGIIGMGAKVSRKGYLCSRCERENCLYRTLKKG